MRLLVSWLRDFVAVNRPASDIAERLALRGFEVASVEPFDDGDGVIDFEVTANRPDCLGVVGLAREVAATYDLLFRAPASSKARPTGPSSGDVLTPVRVAIDDPDLCPRYAAAAAAVTPTSSPDWMVRRLTATGIRPISPFVDITNYVLMETGHPMHAFDLAALGGAEVRARRARTQERLVTLDGVSRTLDSDMLVIADQDQPQAVAGVMGGGASEVTPSTTTIVFESAYFKPASVRRTAKRLGLKTEASARFERGTDINAPLTALRRALDLMEQIGAGRLIGGLVDVYPAPREAGRIGLRRARLASLLGLHVPDADVARILGHLGLTATATSDGWSVVVPTFRVDVLREVDLVEEIGRHFGFDRLEPSFPVVTQPAPAPDARTTRDQRVRRVMTAAGLSEAVTFGFIEAKAARAFVDPANLETLLAVANPLSATFDTMRPSLLPGLVDAVAHNRRHGRRDVALFEVGTRFSTTDHETRGVGLAWTGANGAAHWSTPPREVDFFDVRGVVDAVCTSLGCAAQVDPAVLPFLANGQSGAVTIDGQAIGCLGLLLPQIADDRGAPRADKIWVAELNLDAIDRAGAAARAGGGHDDRIRPLPRYPLVVRDLSVLVAYALPAAIIRGTILAAGASGSAPLSGATFFDRYEGKGLPSGTVSLSVRLTFQSPDRTLTDGDVQRSVDVILAALVREHQAVQR